MARRKPKNIRWQDRVANIGSRQRNRKIELQVNKERAPTKHGDIDRHGACGPPQREGEEKGKRRAIRGVPCKRISDEQFFLSKAETNTVTQRAKDFWRRRVLWPKLMDDHTVAGRNGASWPHANEGCGKGT